jgi:hypothetical protein
LTLAQRGLRKNSGVFFVRLVGTRGPNSTRHDGDDGERRRGKKPLKMTHT